MMTRRWLWLSLLCLLAPLPAWAQDDAKAEEEVLEDEDLLEDEDDDLLGEERLDEIEVIQKPEAVARSGGSTQVLGEDELKELKQDDPEAIVLKLPGVYVRTEDGFGLRPNIGIRGANSERSKKITLMEDGVLFGPAPYAAPAAYYFPMIGRMTAVEVYKGPGAVLFGPNTLGGAINMTTRPIPSGHQGGADISVGSFPTGKLHLWHGWSNDNFGVLVEGIELATAGFKELDGDGPTGFDRTEIMVKAHANTDPNAEVFHRVRLRATWSRESSNETYLGLSDDDFRQNPNRRYASTAEALMQWGRLGLRADYDLEVGEDIKARVTAYRNDFSRSWKKLNGFSDGTSAADVLADPTSRRAIYYDVLSGKADSENPGERLVIGTNARTFVSQGVQAGFQHEHSAKTWSNRLEVGARFHYDEIIRDHTEELYDMTGGRLVRTQDAVKQATHNRDSVLAISGWVLDQFSWGPLTLTPGMRYEHILGTRVNIRDTPDFSVDSTQGVFIPGLGAHVEVLDNFGFLAGAHRGFSPTAPGQLANSETSINYEAGARYANLKTGTRLEAIGFLSDYQNLVGQCTFAAGCQESDLDNQFNAGQARIYGAEVVAAYDWRMGDALVLPMRLTYTLTQTELLTSFTSANPQLASVEEGDALPYVPTHQISGRVGARYNAWSGNVSATYVDAMREMASQGDEGPRTDAYVALGALISYQVADWGSAYLKADNILDARAIASRRPYGARPIRPRYFQLGVNLNWGSK